MIIDLKAALQCYLVKGKVVKLGLLKPIFKIIITAPTLTNRARQAKTNDIKLHDIKRKS